jgi:phage terminase large subunit-like protein
MELSQKQILAQWNEYVENIRRQTALLIGENEEQQRRRIEILEADPELWFKYYFPQYAYAEAAPFQKAATKRVLINLEWYEVRIWARELAKSTRTMMEVLYLALIGKKKYILLISNSFDNAVRLLMPYKGNLEANQRIIHDYGVQELPGKWGAEEFTTRNGVAFRALGAGQSPRGTRNEEIRPDVILFDDIDTDEECRNPEIIKKKWQWIEDAAIATRSISKKTTIIFCGNRISQDCCVERASKMADHSEVMNIRDANGKSTWPQKNTEEHINRVLSTKSYASAQKEYYNNPLTEGTVFKDISYKPAMNLRDYSLLVCYTDPSFKDSKRNDFKATVLVGKWKDEYHVIKCFLEQTTTAKMIEWHYHIMQMIKENACYYLMEQVFLQDILIKEFYEAGKSSGKTIPIVGDQRQKPDKFTRIESLLEPLNRNGKLFFNANEKSNAHMLRLEEQFKAIAPGSRAHDDGPDAVEGAVWYINQKEVAGAAGAIKTYKRPANIKRY